MEDTRVAMTQIPTELYEKLDLLGLIPNEVRNGNIGKSDYSVHTIQPWSIWIDYNLNPWDADVVKRILRTKAEAGMSETEARIMDYQKIKHICDERIRQLQFNVEPSIYPTEVVATNEHGEHEVYTLIGNEIPNYSDFLIEHLQCGGLIQTSISRKSGIGPHIKVHCPICGKVEDITDYTTW